jgi:hypothetical protein
MKTPETIWLGVRGLLLQAAGLHSGSIQVDDSICRAAYLCSKTFQTES